MKIIDPQFLKLLDIVMSHFPDYSPAMVVSEAKSMYRDLTGHEWMIDQTPSTVTKPHEAERLLEVNANLGDILEARQREMEELHVRNQEMAGLLGEMVEDCYITDLDSKPYCKECGQHKGAAIDHLVRCRIVRAKQLLNQEKANG